MFERKVIVSNVVSVTAVAVIAILASKLVEKMLPTDSVLVNNPVEWHLLAMYDHFGHVLIGLIVFGLLTGVFEQMVVGKYIK